VWAVAEVDRRDRRERAVLVQQQPRLEERLLARVAEEGSGGDSLVVQLRLMRARWSAGVHEEPIALA
jgi:hypothetical protein